MKITLPSKEIEVCDICQPTKENQILYTCIFCRKRYWLSCKGGVVGAIKQPDICMNCEEDDNLIHIVERHAPLIKEAIERRDNEIKSAGKNKERIERDLGES